MQRSTLLALLALFIFSSCSSRNVTEVHRITGEITAEKLLKLLSEGHTVVLSQAKVMGKLDFGSLEGVEPTPGYRLVTVPGMLVATEVQFGDSVLAGSQTLSVRFAQPVSFTASTFHNYATFREAVFAEGARFERTEFLSNANFQGAQFRGPGIFAQAIFGDEALFQRSHFYHFANFTKAEFRGDMSFQMAHFQADAHFLAVNVKGYSDFSQSQAQGHLLFNTAIFNGKVTLSSGTFHGRVEFNNCKLMKPLEAIRVLFGGFVSFNQTEFQGTITLSGTRFAAGAPNTQGIVLPTAEPRAVLDSCTVAGGNDFRIVP